MNLDVVAKGMALTKTPFSVRDKSWRHLASNIATMITVLWLFDPNFQTILFFIPWSRDKRTRGPSLLKLTWLLQTFLSYRSHQSNALSKSGQLYIVDKSLSSGKGVYILKLHYKLSARYGFICWIKPSAYHEINWFWPASIIHSFGCMYFSLTLGVSALKLKSFMCGSSINVFKSPFKTLQLLHNKDIEWNLVGRASCR